MSDRNLPSSYSWPLPTTGLPSSTTRARAGAGDGPYDHSHSSALPSLSFANLRRRRPPISVVRSGRRRDGRGRGDAGPHECKHGRRSDVSSELQSDKRRSVASGKGTNDVFISPPLSVSPLDIGVACAGARKGCHADFDGEHSIKLHETPRPDQCFAFAKLTLAHPCKLCRNIFCPLGRRLSGTGTRPTTHPAHLPPRPPATPLFHLNIPLTSLLGIRRTPPAKGSNNRNGANVASSRNLASIRRDTCSRFTEQGGGGSGVRTTEVRGRICSSANTATCLYILRVSARRLQYTT